MTTIEELNGWLKHPEGRNLEFKEAKNKFNDSKLLPDYCAAIANEGGGKLILGVNNARHVVGTMAFLGTYQKISNTLLNALKIRVDVEEILHPDGRVLIFHIPKRPHGQLIVSTGNHQYPMRAGESLVNMDLDTIKKILNETEPDFSSHIVPGLTFDDLDRSAIEIVRKKWGEESRQEKILKFDDEKTLTNIGLLTGKGINYAGLILVGKSSAITEYLPDAEVIFEYRHNPNQIHHDFRKNWREPFAAIDDDIWSTINARNIRIPFQQGFFQREIWGFDEKSIREAVHNAVMHRDYSLKGRSVFIKASPRGFDIESPGGFPLGITLENVLTEKAWRNRTLADAFEKIGFAERSSQGLDEIFEKSIRDGKGFPDLSKSNASHVKLYISAQVQDTDFILYLERISEKLQVDFKFEEIYELENIREHQKIDHPEYKNKFLNLGIVEMIGRGRGTKYILSRHYYETIGKSGAHTRIKGLSRQAKKELILGHIREGKPSSLMDLMSGFPECGPKDISNLLQELKRDGAIFFQGSKLKGSWRIRSTLN